jgi:hypothetical protein
MQIFTGFAGLIGEKTAMTSWHAGCTIGRHHKEVCSHMRKILLLIASLGFVSVVAAAQHPNANEKPVRTQLTVPFDVMVGTTMLKAGEYNVICDREMITFARRAAEKSVQKFECKGRELSEAAKTTSLHTSTTPSGIKKVDKLLLKGSNIEHVF